jgi:hypothetical protein
VPKQLSFGTPTQIPPTTLLGTNLRNNCPDAIEDPLNRLEKWVLTTKSMEAVHYYQKLNEDNTWGTETILHSTGVFSRGISRICADGTGNLMVVSFVTDGTSTYYVRTWFIPRDGSGIQVVSHYNDNALTQPIFLSVKTLSSTKILLSFNRKRPGTGTFDLVYKVWDSSTLTWGSEQNMGHPSDDVGSGVNFGIYEGSMDVSPLDGSVHAVGIAEIGSPFYGQIWYKTFNPLLNTEGTWSLVRDLGFPNQDRLPTIWASNAIPGQVYIATWRLNGSANTSAIEMIWGNGEDWDSVQVSQGNDLSAMSPHCIIDGPDDDLYFCWTEYNTSSGFMGLWARGVSKIGNLDSVVNVADSFWNTTNSWSFPPAAKDPEYPRFVRYPRFKRLVDLCVVWGDTWESSPSTNNPTTWITCAPVNVPNGGDWIPETGGVISNNDVLMYDEASQSPWLKWKGQ